MNKATWLICFLSIIPATSLAQSRQNSCVLDTARHGQMLLVNGTVVQQPHDLAFNIRGCDDLTVLTFAGDRDTDVPADRLRRDKNLSRFQKYTTAVYPSDGRDLCLQCSQYGNVKATLSGKLEIAEIPQGTTRDQLGFLHDPSGKVVGTSGFGHPNRRFKYRLVIFAIIEVKAQKLPKPKPSTRTP